jgi:hypothetical protein
MESLQDQLQIPTSNDILADLIKKQIWNKQLIQFAKNLQVFNISSKEYYISEVKNLQITFTCIDDNSDIKRYIEDLQGLKITDYVLIHK